MKNLDEALITFERHGGSPKILDIGGWFAPCRMATDMVDIMPFETLNRAGAYGPGEMKIEKAKYLQLDLGSVDRLPYSDKEFDFVICRHTLEDIRDPIHVCSEMVRVAKSGYIETPHRVYESTKGVERHWWCGHYHHRWLVEMGDGKVVFQFKPHNIHSTPRFYFRCFPWKKVREEFKNTSLLWNGQFTSEEHVIIDYRDVQSGLTTYKKKMRDQRIFRWRWKDD